MIKIKKGKSITSQAIFSEDGLHRFILSKVWDKKLEKAMVIMKKPSNANSIMLDTTTMLVINNVYKLGYGSVEILNLFSTIHAKNSNDLLEDKEIIDINIKYIKESAIRADKIILAWGIGCISTRIISDRINYIISNISRYKDKLFVIQNQTGRSGFHPLSPSVRNHWGLKPCDYDFSEANIDESKTLSKTVQSEKGKVKSKRKSSIKGKENDKDN